MRSLLTRTTLIFSIAMTCVTGAAQAADNAASLQARIDQLEAEVVRGEDLSALKRLQRTYGYYVDKGMWADLAEYFSEDAVANYPAGVFIGKPSIREHLFLNVGGGQMGEIGLREGRIYNHMNLQPVIHLDPGGRTAKGRWRAFAMFGAFGGGATWAEGIYEMGYIKDNGVWKIRTLDYHSGFGASYDTGWGVTPPARPPAAPAAPGAATPARGGRPPLAHAPDRVREMACDGFPAACVGPFHYQNPGISPDGLAWNSADPMPLPARRGDAATRVTQLAHRASLLRDEVDIENLQRIYGYYLDRAMWDEVADLFADDGTIEMGLQGVYAGKSRVRQFLGTLGPHGLTDGWLNDHLQLQLVVSVAADGRTAKARSRELGMTGHYQQGGAWSEGIYENSFVKQDGVWKIKSLHLYPTFISDYDKGWARDAQPAPTASTTLPPDRPPTEIYAIYPKSHIPPYHYRNPVTGEPSQYPAADAATTQARLAALQAPASGGSPAKVRDVDAALTAVQRQIQRFKDYHEIENLESAYGYYLDKNLWNDLANLFARDSSMELAQRGVYSGPGRVRGFLFNIFGRGGPGGPVEGQLGNHVQFQPVIHVADDGKTANIRIRMMQQLSFGGRSSMGAAVYENQAIKEDGVWKFKSVHAYNTFTASYDGGWAKSPGRGVPGPSKDFPPDSPPSLVFAMFPTVYPIPFHYRNPVTGNDAKAFVAQTVSSTPAASAGSGAMPPEIAAELRAIGARIEGQRTTEIYAALQPKEPYPGVTVTRDIKYGPADRNVLDVFTAPVAGTGKPVIVFIHGGGFSRGAKRAPGSPFYDNIMLWAVAHGMVGANINYRLAPEHMWPAGIEDLAALVGWLKANVAVYGGDPDRIFLWGHSAGAAHVGDYLARMALSGRESGLAGAILTSGFYDLGKEVSIWKAYYGEDLSTYAERSSLPGLLKTTTPLLVTDAELDPPNFQVDSDKLTAARAEVGKPVLRLRIPGHSHLSETYAIGTSDRSLSDPVLAFIRSGGATSR